ncbi:MAG TPA: hypothetical protein DCZ13_14970 [Porticoccaceae bacterium]|nr:hypothetical protein [Porticoccaceae bacterium]
MFGVAAALLVLSLPVLASEIVGSESTELETVIVTATRTEKNIQDVPVSISVQDMNVLLEQGVTYGADEFRYLPG